MSRRAAPDGFLFAGTLMLLVFGLVMLYSASAFVAEAGSRSPFHFLTRQAVWAIAGMGLMIAAARLDYRVLARPAVAWGLFAVIAALLVATLGTAPINGSSRWIRLFGFTLQPSEPAKLAVIILVAHLVARNPPDTWRRLLAPLGCIAVICGLIFLQPDLGTATFLGITGVMIVYLGGARILHLGALAGVAVPLMAAGILSAEYRVRRVTSFLDPFADPLDHGFQLVQSLIALGRGGLTGVGFSNGEQKLLYLPEPHADFVFSVIGEELGLIGGAAVIAVFFLYGLRALVVSAKAPDLFGKLVGCGAALAITLQAFINISVATGLMPTTGLPLPFVSAGGSALLTSMIAAGLILSVSQRVP